MPRVIVKDGEMSFDERRAAHLAFMLAKIAEKDWHGVADAAMDMRDIDSEQLGYEKARRRNG